MNRVLLLDSPGFCFDRVSLSSQGDEVNEYSSSSGPFVLSYNIVTCCHMQTRRENTIQLFQVGIFRSCLVAGVRPSPSCLHLLAAFSSCPTLKVSLSLRERFPASFSLCSEQCFSAALVNVATYHTTWYHKFSAFVFTPLSKKTKEIQCVRSRFHTTRPAYFFPRYSRL